MKHTLSLALALLAFAASSPTLGGPTVSAPKSATSYQPAPTTPATPAPAPSLPSDLAESGFKGFYHPRQEGKDAPYGACVSLALALNPSTSTTVKNEGQDDSTLSKQSVDFRSAWLMVFGPIAVGPSLSYARAITKYSETVPAADGSEDTTTRDVTVSSTSYAYGLRLDYFLARIDKDRWVPYGTVSFDWTSITSNDSSIDTTEEEIFGTVAEGGLGLHYFIDSNVALSPQLVYGITTTHNEDSSHVEIEAKPGLEIGITTFI